MKDKYENFPRIFSSSRQVTKASIPPYNLRLHIYHTLRSIVRKCTASIRRYLCEVWIKNCSNNSYATDTRTKYTRGIKYIIVVLQVAPHGMQQRNHDDAYQRFLCLSKDLTIVVIVLRRLVFVSSAAAGQWVYVHEKVKEWPYRPSHVEHEWTTVHLELKLV